MDEAVPDSAMSLAKRCNTQYGFRGAADTHAGCVGLRICQLLGLPAGPKHKRRAGDRCTLAAPFFAFFAEGCVGADLARALLLTFAMPREAAMDP